MSLQIFLISIIVGASIGYLTNWLAIYSLFRPRKKFLGFQGLLPRYKKSLAVRISEHVHHILPDSVKKSFNIPFIGDKIKNFLENSIAEEITKMPDQDLEKIIRKIVSKELRYIEILGGIIGALVGLVQAIIITNLI
jgi:uncharacterized membrane protein YheB (UPF0754 family)